MIEYLASRLLLIAPQFFGYEQDILETLESFGYEVDLLPDRPFNNPIFKAAMRFHPELGGHRLCDKFFADSLEKFGRSKYSTILVIQGEGVSSNTLIKLRNTYPEAKLIFYTWDSLQNKPFSKRKLFLYDCCYTFDPEDAKEYGMYFRPLFFTKGFDRPAETTYIYDLSFIGTAHSDRYKIIHQLLEQLPQERTFIYLYLQAQWMFDLRRMFTNTIDGSKREDFYYKPLSKDLVQTIFFDSRAVLDIEHVKQCGATMRTMEALGSQRKIVTTNSTLKNYDFFNPANILIIDRKAPRIDHEFLQTPYQVIPEKVKQKYSLQQWIIDVCSPTVRM